MELTRRSFMKLAAALTGVAALEFGTPLRIISADPETGEIDVAEDTERQSYATHHGKAVQFSICTPDGSECHKLTGVKTFDITMDTVRAEPFGEFGSPERWHDPITPSGSFDIGLGSDGADFDAMPLLGRHVFYVNYGTVSMVFSGVLSSYGGDANGGRMLSFSMSGKPEVRIGDKDGSST